MSNLCQTTPAATWATKAAGAMSEDVRKCPDAENALSPKQRAAIDLLLLGKSASDTARAVEVDPRTVYRWRHDERFADELQRRHRELWSLAAERLKALVHPSLDVLEKQLADRFDRTRFRAAAAILRLSDLRKAMNPQEN